MILYFSKGIITFHTCHPYPLYLPPISRFYFTSLRFYSIFASPFYYCYNASYVFFLFFHVDYVSFCYTFSDIFLSLSISPSFNFALLCLSVIYAYILSFLILQSNHFILSLLFSNFFHSKPPYLTKGQTRNVILLHFLQIYVFCTWIINFVDYCDPSVITLAS